MKWQEKTKVLRDLKAQMQALLDEKESMAGESQDLTKQKAKLELNIKDLKDEEAGHKSSKVCIDNKVSWFDHIVMFDTLRLSIEEHWFAVTT